MLRRLALPSALVLAAYWLSRQTEQLQIVNAQLRVLRELAEPRPFVLSGPNLSVQEWQGWFDPAARKSRSPILPLSASTPGAPAPRPEPSLAASQEETLERLVARGSTGASGRWTPPSGAPTEGSPTPPDLTKPPSESRTSSPTEGGEPAGGSPGPVRSGYGLDVKEQIEARGYTAICAPTFADWPGCENHRHVPGEKRTS